MKTFGKLVSMALFHHPIAHSERPASPQAMRKWSKYGAGMLKPSGPHFPPDNRPQSRRPKVSLPKLSIQDDD
jgi:hypothetical protein